MSLNPALLKVAIETEMKANLVAAFPASAASINASPVYGLISQAIADQVIAHIIANGLVTVFVPLTPGPGTGSMT